MSVLEAFTFLSFWALGLSLSRVEQSQISVSAEVKKSVDINCKIESTNFPTEAVHWYRQRMNQALEHLIFVSSVTVPAQSQIGGKSNKVVARKNSQTFTSTLTVNFIEKEDEGIYYCAGWTSYNKIFGAGTKLFVIDRNLATDMTPKPTVFLPSIAEIEHSKVGTYLCLLEKFFPNAIQVYWKEKNDNRVLESMQGNTVKTDDTYMKFSWLTVSEESMGKEHICFVKHEKNRVEPVQEILFPSINEVVSSAVMPTDSSNDCLKDESKVSDSDSRKACVRNESEVTNSTKACLKDESNTLQLQLENTSAYYTYLLLLLKSTLYFATVLSCLFRRTVCSSGKTS
uniref:Ig-like domain-containing protein n=1 Tax=Sus scrofa TaxID=9823 RepID=A0A8D1YY66_PIG